MERNGTGLSREATNRDSGAPIVVALYKTEGGNRSACASTEFICIPREKMLGGVCPKKIFVDEWAFGESFERS